MPKRSNFNLNDPSKIGGVLNIHNMNFTDENGLRQGEWKSYYPDGNLSYKGNYLIISKL